MLELKATVALCQSTPPYMRCCVAVLFRHVHRGLRGSGSSNAFSHVVVEDSGLIWTQIRGSVARVAGAWLTCG